MLLILCSSCDDDGTEQAQQWLLITVPARVGDRPGAIQGTANPAPLINDASLLVIVARCGGIDPAFRNGVSDMFQVTSRSTGSDHDVVACVKKAVAVDFDAQVAWGDRKHPERLDTSPFADLAVNSLSASEGN